MCQYMANDGCASAWHTQHLMSLAMSGAGLIMLEATAVSRSGRITHGCLGLYSDANEDALAMVLEQARRVDCLEQSLVFSCLMLAGKVRRTVPGKDLAGV